MSNKAECHRRSEVSLASSRCGRRNASRDWRLCGKQCPTAGTSGPKPLGRMTRLRKADCVPSNTVRRVADTVIGAILGLVAGAIIAINLIITAGVERGYEASLIEVFEENALVAVAAVAILVVGPVVGVIIARRIRRRMEQ